MKKFMAILLALALTALMPAAFAQAADDFGYVDRFTLEDGTELPVTVEHKTNWEYQTYQDTLVAKDIPVYTVTIPEGTESVQVSAVAKAETIGEKNQPLTVTAADLASWGVEDGGTVVLQLRIAKYKGADPVRILPRAVEWKTFKVQYDATVDVTGV
ncbi:MAG: hypothetical protein MR371_02630, partial [Clostridia bacterium]|nr:hypothetical protein [Clostridia bacterium]